MGQLPERWCERVYVKEKAFSRLSAAMCTHHDRKGRAIRLCPELLAHSRAVRGPVAHDRSLRACLTQELDHVREPRRFRVVVPSVPF